MPIISSEIIDYSPYGERFEITVRHIFSDGRVIDKKGGMYVSGPEQAQLLLVESANDTQRSVTDADAEYAANNGILSAYGEAPTEKVLYHVMLKAYNDPELYSAWRLVKDIAPALLGLGLTDAEYAAMFSTTEVEVRNMIEFWQHLSDNAGVISAYSALVN